MPSITVEDLRRYPDKTPIICYHAAGREPKLIHTDVPTGMFLGVLPFTGLTDFPDTKQDIWEAFWSEFVRLHTFGLFQKNRFCPFYITKPSSLAASDCVDLDHYVQELREAVSPPYPRKDPVWMKSEPEPAPINTPRLANQNLTPRPLKRKRKSSLEEVAEYCMMWQRAREKKDVELRWELPG